MTKEAARRFKIFRMVLKVEGGGKVPELMGGHVNPDAILKAWMIC